jgi:hypothetical protein
VSDIEELMGSLDLEAALARTYDRHDELVRRAAKRRNRVIVGCVAGIAAALLIIVPIATSGGPSHKVPAPALAGRPGPTTTTSDPNAEPLVPVGFVQSVDGAILTLTSTTPELHDASSAPGVAASSTASERARIVSSSHGPVLRSVTVRFNCFRLPEKIHEVSYVLTPDALVISASISYIPDGQTCPSPDDGPVITLPLTAPLPVGTPVVAGSVLSH